MTTRWYSILAQIAHAGQIWCSSFPQCIICIVSAWMEADGRDSFPLPSHIHHYPRLPLFQLPKYDQIYRTAHQTQLALALPFIPALVGDEVSLAIWANEVISNLASTNPMPSNISNSCYLAKVTPCELFGCEVDGLRKRNQISLKSIHFTTPRIMKFTSFPYQ